MMSLVSFILIVTLMTIFAAHLYSQQQEIIKLLDATATMVGEALDKLEGEK